MLVLEFTIRFRWIKIGMSKVDHKNYRIKKRILKNSTTKMEWNKLGA